VSSNLVGLNNEREQVKGENNETCSTEECVVHDVVKFIVEKMKKNAKSQASKDIRANNESNLYEQAYEEYQKMPWWQQLLFGTNYIQNMLNADMAAHAAAAAQFGCLVADARTRPVCGQWDYKKEIGEKFGNSQTIAFCSIGHTEKVIFYYDIWANIHYGYVGKAGAFSDEALLSGAALEQSVAHPGQTQDDPSDQASIKMGIELYKQEGDSVTETGVLMQLYIHQRELNKVRRNDKGEFEVYR